VAAFRQEGRIDVKCIRARRVRAQRKSVEQEGDGDDTARAGRRARPQVGGFRDRLRPEVLDERRRRRRRRLDRRRRLIATRKDGGGEQREQGSPPTSGGIF
jgi:hypothetical protein